MISNETSHRQSSLFGPFSNKPRFSDGNPPSPTEYDDTSTVDSYTADKGDNTQLLRPPAEHVQLRPRPTSVRIPPNTSPDIAQNWLTTNTYVPNAIASPRFSRHDVKSVIMPVKAERPLSAVGLGEGFGDAMMVHRAVQASDGSEDDAPSTERDDEPERLGPLQRVRSQMWNRRQQMKPSEKDQTHGQDGGQARSGSQGESQRQDQDQDQAQGGAEAQGPGRRQGIVSALGRGLSLSSVRRLRSRTKGGPRRRHTTDAGVRANAEEPYGYSSADNRQRDCESIPEESSSIRDVDGGSLQDKTNVSLRRSTTDPSLRRSRKWPWGGLLKKMGRS